MSVKGERCRLTHAYVTGVRTSWCSRSFSDARRSIVFLFVALNVFFPSSWRRCSGILSSASSLKSPDIQGHSTTRLLFNLISRSSSCRIYINLLSPDWLSLWVKHAVLFHSFLWHVDEEPLLCSLLLFAAGDRKWLTMQTVGEPEDRQTGRRRLMLNTM